jgi:hypothetical protein
LGVEGGANKYGEQEEGSRGREQAVVFWCWIYGLHVIPPPLYLFDAKYSKQIL